MWQLHHSWTAQEREETLKTEQIRLETSRVRRLLMYTITLGCAVLAGLLGFRLMHPPNYLIAALWGLGAGALSLLLAVIPRQAWRVLRRGWIWLQQVWRRRALLRVVLRERACLRRAAEEVPSGPVLCDLAVAEYLRGHLERAEAHLANALELAPEDSHLLNNLGVILARQEQQERAAELFVRALNNGAEQLAATNCALLAPQVTNPERLSELASDLGHTLTETALNNIGVATAMRGDWAAAENYFDRAAFGPSPLPAARANRALVAYRREQLQEAADEILQANRDDPNEPTFANHLGVILAAAGQVEQARAYLWRASRVAPASLPVRINSTAVDAVAGHWHVAQKGFKGLLHEQSYRAEIYYNLAVCELAIEEPAHAADAAAAAIAHGNTTSEAYTVLAVALWEVGRRGEALSHFQSAVSAPGATAVAYSNLGRALLTEGKTKQAAEVLQRGLGQWPDDPHLTFDVSTCALAGCALTYDESVPAVQRREAAGNQAPCLGLQTGLQRPELAAEAHVNLGLEHYMQERYETAAEHFEAAGRLLPRNRGISFLIGTALGKAGERQTHRTEDGDVAPTGAGRELLRRAVPHLEAATEWREVLVPASHNLGRCLYVLKEFERALAAFRKSIRQENTAALNSMAALAAAREAQRLQLLLRTQFLSEGKREQMRGHAKELLNVAVHYFRQALLHNEMDPVLHGNLGVAYMLRNRENDVEAALRHWERMRAIGGGAAERRFAELSQMEDLADPSRIGFDDRSAKLRGLEPLRWLAVPAPRSTGIRFVTEPVAVQRPWRLAVTSQRLRQALELRDAIAAGDIRLQRLRV